LSPILADKLEQIGREARSKKIDGTKTLWFSVVVAV